MNTHLDNFSRTSRLRSADELRRIVSASPLPTVMTGDFNADAETDPYEELTGHGLLLDTWVTAHTRLTEVWGSFPNYREPRHDTKRIDWILTTPTVVVLSAAVNTTRYKEGWPSDHAAVQAVVQFSSGTAER